MLEGEPSSTSDQPGGQLRLTTDVENFPGFVDGVMGPELMTNMRAQAVRFGAEIHTVKVSRVDFSERPHKVWVGNQDEPDYLAHTVIVATGAQSLMLGLPAEQRLMGHGLSTCATCGRVLLPRPRHCGHRCGDSALEEAMFLTRFAPRVSLYSPSVTLYDQASKIMQDRCARERQDPVLVEHRR
ncbi:UNVERIFIED_CONTAM: hypothetical protein GTU68_017233 [Idotea baltica]|nr:hypothetical protein [Idotea baltica]